MVDRLLERHVGVYIIRACADDTSSSIYWKSAEYITQKAIIKQARGVYVCLYFCVKEKW